MEKVAMKAVVSLFLFTCLSAGLLAEPAAAVPPATLPAHNIFYPHPAAITLYKTYSSLDFHPASSSIAYTLGSDGSLYPDSTSSAQFSARLDLPSGASVSEVDFYFYDNASPADIQFKISTYDPTGSSFDKGTITSTGCLSSIQMVSLSFENFPVPIQNDTYSYQLLVIFNAAGGLQKLYGATVAYTDSGSPVQDDHLTFVGTDFHPATSNMTYDSNSISSSTRVFCSSGSPPCSFLAPIYLPQGSQVTEVDYYVVNNNSSNNLTMQINDFNPLTNNLAAWGAASTAGKPVSDNVLTIVITGNPLFTVDNTTRGYAVSIQPTMISMEQQVVGARIHFTPGPASNFRSRTLAGYDFQPNLSKVEFSTQGGTIFPQDDQPTGTFTANLDLPDGNVVYQLTVYFKKLSGTTDNFSLAVKSYSPGSGSGAVLQSANTNGYTTGITLRTLIFPGTVAKLGKMDAQDSNWRLEVTPSAADDRLVLYGAQVQYFFPAQTFMPSIKK
jgi:hypothetical protein